MNLITFLSSLFQDSILKRFLKVFMFQVWMVGTRSHFSKIEIKTCTSLPLCSWGMCEGWPRANILGGLADIQQNSQCTCQSSLCMHYSKGFLFFLSASCTVSIDLAAELSLKLVTAVNCVRSTIIRTSVMQAV